MSAAEVPAASLGLPPLVGRQSDHHHSHHVQFYSEDSALLDDLSPFVGGAISSGGSAVVIATPAHLQGLADQLLALGIDIKAATAQSRFVALDAEETLAKFMLEGWPDTSRFMEVIGSVMAKATAAAIGQHTGQDIGHEPRVVAFGEMVALLNAAGKTEAALRLEQLWNELAQTHSFHLRCAYPIHEFQRQDQHDAFLSICAEHSAVIPSEEYTSLTTDDQRLRTIAELQQRAQALESEVAERKRIEEELRLSKANLERQVQQRTAALHKLSSQILVSQDSERRRIARELHDSLGQYLVGLKLNIHLLHRTPERDDLWSEAGTLLEQSIVELRTISYLLHPPMMDIGGLPAAARWYIDGFAKRSGMEVAVTLPDNPVRWPDTVEILLFRVLQEALTNVHRHSGASTAQVEMCVHPEHVSLRISDNGQGISPDALQRFNDTGLGMGVGLTGMRERVRELSGTFTLDSTPAGTTIQISVPLASSKLVPTT